MNKTLLLLIYFFTIQIGYSQIQSGKLTYKITSPDAKELVDLTIKEDVATASRKYIENRIKQTVATLPYIELELYFTPYEAIMETNKFMRNDNNLDIKNALGRINTSGVYYSNIKEDLFLHETIFNNPYLIQSPFNELDWELHDETKEILGYTCIKATTTLAYPFNDFPTTVWFTPELPFPFGPKEFRGLPGLILAMEFNHYYFYANSIDLFDKSRKIKKPTKGKKVSREEYFKELLEHDRAFLKSIGGERD